ncbi:hypothetical protein IQ243_09555 [Nostocales cyanobacterium LEGE 11386]|nr:hypothetical protein [Nostocales cyanobacterium LEGE 11386]
MHNAKLKVNSVRGFAYAVLFAYAIIQGGKIVVDKKSNAKTKEVPGRNSQPDGENDRQGLEELRASGFVDGIGEQNRLVSRNCQANDSNRNAYSQPEEFNAGVHAGKILEEVLLLKEQFLDYLKSDQDQLEAKLDATKKQEHEFLSKTEALERRLKTALLQEIITEENQQ